MMGTVQLGLLAACVVLFVPMGMAGWHLSRNKVLFFGGALFITLAVGVHLVPYFPAFSQLISSLPPPPVVSSPRSCLSFLHDIVWEHDSSPNSTAKSWAWLRSAPVSACGFQKLERSDARDLLNGSWVLVAGDSQARLFVVALLNLALDAERMVEIEADLFKRHSDYQIVIQEQDMKVDFVWAPYELNLTNVVGKLREQRRYPDVLVMGTGLWHMLHITNPSDYGVMLSSLKRSAESLVPVRPEFRTDEQVFLRSPHMFWLGLPTLISPLLNTEEKKEKMTHSMLVAYARQVSKSELLRGMGGHFTLLDIASLSQDCGSSCTSDGMHYDGVVYDAALQILLNALIIESQQRI